MTKKEKIKLAAARRKENKDIDFVLSLRENRLFLRAKTRNSVSVEMDVTPVWYFCKEVLETNPSKNSLNNKVILK